MKSAVVFNGPDTLDFFDLRTLVIRIPEVSLRLREAQQVWDRAANSSFDLFYFLCSEDSVYLADRSKKSLVANIVQVGLYDRYERLHGKPQAMLGCASGDSALLACLGWQSFPEMILGSQALTAHRARAGNLSAATARLASGAAARTMSPVAMSEPKIPVLSGQEPSQFDAYQICSGSLGVYQCIEVLKNMEIRSLVRAMIELHNITCFINIGPGNILFSRGRNDLWLDQATLTESIDMDPMLHWFWSEVAKPRFAMAQ